MAKSKDFEINSNEPSGGMTFAGNKTHIMDTDTKTTQTKRKAAFGVMDEEPQRITFQDPVAHPMPLPKADKAPLISKAIYTSGGQGQYSPPAGQLKSGSSYAGRPGIGGSSPKHGKTDKIAQKFKV